MHQRNNSNHSLGHNESQDNQIQLVTGDLLAKMGPIPLGEARETPAGNLPFESIIHVAGINMLWFVTEYSVTESVKSAMKIVNEQGYKSVAFPLIGAGSGNRRTAFSLNIMLRELNKIETNAKAKVVKYVK